MAQISRPFQIALGAVVLLALVWVLALHAHQSNPNEPVSASAPTPTAVAKLAREAAARRRADHRSSAHKTQVATHKAVAQKTIVRKTVVTTHTTTSDPRTVAGVHHRVVVTSTHKVATAPHKVATAPHKVATAPHKVATAPHKAAPVSHKVVVTHSTHAPTAPSSRSDSSAPNQHKRPAGQLAVEAELAQGKTVMLVFWNPDTYVDQEVHSQASALVSGSKGMVVMHSALANQVNMFGSITEVVRVYQTPTILIVNRHGVVSTLTGLTEVFALQQAVREAQHAGQ